MKFSGGALYRYEIPLNKPLAVKGRSERTRTGLLIQLKTGDREGWGEMAPLPGFSHESLDETIGQAESALEQVLENGLPSQGSAALYPSVQFGLDMASDALSSPESRSGCLKVNALLDGDLDDVLLAAEHAVKQGFTTLKCKVGRKPVREDILMVNALSEWVGPGIQLRLDANRAWSLEEAIQFSEGVQRCPIEYIEEPVSAPGNLQAYLSANLLPLALDETLTIEKWDGAQSLEGVYAWILKPMLIGTCLDVADYCERARIMHIRPVFSALFESGLGIRHIARLALEYGDGDAAGLDTYRWIEKDIVHPPLDFSGGFLDFPGKNTYEINSQLLERIDHG